MDIHKIKIAGWISHKHELKSSYKNKQEAISDLKEAFAKEEFKFSIEEEGNKTIFLNESGNELAAVVPA